MEKALSRKERAEQKLLRKNEARKQKIEMLEAQIADLRRALVMKSSEVWPGARVVPAVGDPRLLIIVPACHDRPSARDPGEPLTSSVILSSFEPRLRRPLARKTTYRGLLWWVIRVPGRLLYWRCWPVPVYFPVARAR